MEKRKIAIFVAGTLIFGAGVSAHLNRERSEALADHITSYANTFEDDDFLISAHRGFSSLAVENTTEAYELASSKKYVDYIEMDARMTADGKLALAHNEGLTITADVCMDVSSLTLEQLQRTIFHYDPMPIEWSVWQSPEKGFILRRFSDLNGQEYQVPSLIEGIKACGDKKILLDLKFNQNIPEFVEELKEELKDVDTSNIIFQSLDLEGIRYLKEHSDFNCLALISTKTDLLSIDEFDHVGVKASLLTPEIVQKLHEKNGVCAIWTIDSSKALDKAVDVLGDYYHDVIYITNFPDKIACELHDKEYIKSMKDQ